MEEGEQREEFETGSTVIRGNTMQCDLDKSKHNLLKQIDILNKSMVFDWVDCTVLVKVLC